MHAEIITPPTSMRVGLGSAPVSLSCVVHGDDLHWSISDGDDSIEPHEFRERGIVCLGTSHVHDVVSSSLTIAVTTAVNNNTRVVCEAVVAGDPVHVPSSPATIFIAGKNCTSSLLHRSRKWGGGGGGGGSPPNFTHC